MAFKLKCPKCGSQACGIERDPRAHGYRGDVADLIFSCRCGKQLFGQAAMVEFERQKGVYEAWVVDHADELEAEETKKREDRERDEQLKAAMVRHAALQRKLGVDRVRTRQQEEMARWRSQVARPEPEVAADHERSNSQRTKAAETERKRVDRERQAALERERIAAEQREQRERDRHAAIEREREAAAEREKAAKKPAATAKSKAAEREAARLAEREAEEKAAKAAKAKKGKKAPEPEPEPVKVEPVKIEEVVPVESGEQDPNLCTWIGCLNPRRPGSLYCSRECSNKNARHRHAQRRKDDEAA
jgi:hypothetical protein